MLPNKDRYHIDDGKVMESKENDIENQSRVLSATGTAAAGPDSLSSSQRNATVKGEFYVM